ncbi:hypothetical protein [Ligilactobacillus salivarius]|uniref:hypothetical protein n=1 Tax=Ligilactobacillus salivarius TaxID=1624 RepID=UPI00155547BD|nr:hypothetical protein [Ligilactobacillus salivarius]MBL1057703.1 hypothetical protein [Ligilactobacillus salivarius]
MYDEKYIEKLEKNIININIVLGVATDEALNNNINETQGLLSILSEVTNDLVNEIYNR